MFGSLFRSSSDSRSSNTYTTTTTTTATNQNADQSNSSGLNLNHSDLRDNEIHVSNGVVEALDAMEGVSADAFKSMGSLADRAFNSVDDSYRRAIDLVESDKESMFGMVSNQVSAVTDLAGAFREETDEMGGTIKLVLIGLAIIALIAVIAIAVAWSK